MAKVCTLEQFRKWFVHKLTDDEQLRLEDEALDSVSKMSGQLSLEDEVRDKAVKEFGGWK